MITYTLKDDRGSSFKSLNVSFHSKNDLKHPYFSYFIGLFLAYEKGILPFSGSLVDQPAKIIEIFEVIQQLRLEREETVRKSIEKENKRNAKS